MREISAVPEFTVSSVRGVFDSTPTPDRALARSPGLAGCTRMRYAFVVYAFTIVPIVSGQADQAKFVAGHHPDVP